MLIHDRALKTKAEKGPDTFFPETVPPGAILMRDLFRNLSAALLAVAGTAPT